MTELTGRAREWVETVALPDVEIVRISVLTGGYRNDNLLLEGVDGGKWVLRGYGSANRADVETALAAKLRGVVPVAGVVAKDPAGPSLLLDFVEGTPVDRLLPTLSTTEAEAVGVAAGRVLAAIGTIEFDRPGFFADASLQPKPNEPMDLATFVEESYLDPGWDLSPYEVDGLRSLARAWTPLADAVGKAASLVHADFNPKNLLAERDGESWRITVLDWEFAFSGNPLADLGNVLRFGQTSFTAGVVAGVGPLPDGWRDTARALDLFALADFLSRPPKQPLAADIRDVVRKLVQRGPSSNTSTT
jgi:fructokinase